MKVKKSIFDSSHTCVHIDSSHEKYEELLPFFKKHGLAFKQERVIFFDVDSLKSSGYYNKTTLTFIEAHEIAHSVLKHTKSNPMVEAEADFLAILLCKDFNREKSANFGLKEFKPRNNISFDAFSKKYKDKIIKRIKN